MQKNTTITPPVAITPAAEPPMRLADQAVAVEPFTAFATLGRGEPAPDWLTREVTSAWGLDPERTRLALIAVSENATFRVEVDAHPHAVLRVHRPGYVDPAQIRSELQWVRSLGEDVDISVPDVVPRADGELLHTFNRGSADGAPAGEAPWHMVAFAFVQGAVLEDIIDVLPDPSSYYRRIGRATAEFHRHAENWQPPLGFDRFQWRVQDMIGRSSRWGDWRAAPMQPQQHQILQAAEAAAVKQVQLGAPTHQGWGLIHADLRPSNIMMHQDRLTVIDFDDCGYGWFLYDFASALSFIEHEPYAGQIAREWIIGYRSVRELTAEDLRFACALSMLRRLTMLGWTTTHRRDALPPEIWDAQLPGSVEVAQRYLESPSWLLS
ncbi:phosphotransferase enzyme family protein [Nesterenkonia sandarakina]|uniref:Ser/Thr protein kinase RdoA (MazF antagonist) n=1 Tax=Nesterenkonia sandarakina TaxID=272918 RepID=A0A7Z0E7Q5_9MICC|nr:phosphotransferase [Nesterenkonia sandarakina]NYJ16453.1 Ser/Thr protein kinase RdoA (MazF antagonist) [Nesterenkonia sandarakina]